MPVPTSQPRRKRYEPLWDRVDANRVRLAAYIAVFVCLSVLVIDGFLVVVALAAWLVLSAFNVLDIDTLTRLLMYGTPIPGSSFVNISVTVAVVALVWSVFAITRSERWLLQRLGALFVPKGELLDTKLVLKDMAISAGLAVAPALYVMDTPNVNAFIVASPRRRAAVGVTLGMVNKLRLDEQRAVFANLVAQLNSGDTMTASGLTALMMPVHAWRDWSLERQEGAAYQPRRQLLVDPTTGEQREIVSPDLRVILFLPAIVFGVAMAILGEIIAAGHRRAQLRAAETADAEGMLLLKEPVAMLDALEKCIRLNNCIPVADETYGQLFYCWPGESTDDESDPEWERVSRLREVLGVVGEAWAAERVSQIDHFVDEVLPPVAPWAEE